MYKKLIENKERSLFGNSSLFTDKQLIYLKKSPEYFFYNIIFKNINEYDYSVLYDNRIIDNSKDIFDKSNRNATGRPNVSVKYLVGSIFLLNHYGLTHKELFQRLVYDALFRIALGLESFGFVPFSESTFYNFQNRLSDYYDKTGINLLEKTFDRLTKQQINSLKIKTNIQRTDSFQAISNIKKYTRLSLLVEIIKRVYRVISPEEQLLFKEMFSTYIVGSSENFVYKLDNMEIDEKLKSLVVIYDFIYKNYYNKYPELKEFKNFIRVYQEHFTFKLPKLEIEREKKKLKKRKTLKFKKQKKKKK